MRKLATTRFRIGSIQRVQGFDCFPAKTWAEARALFWRGENHSEWDWGMEKTGRTGVSQEKHRASGRREYISDFHPVWPFKYFQSEFWAKVFQFVFWDVRKMSMVLVTPPSPLLEIVWISLNDFNTSYYLCDITLGTVRIRSAQDQQSNFPIGIMPFIWEFFLGSIGS
jgi:hypothetical protein